MMNPSTRIHWTVAVALAALIAGMAPAAFAGDVAAGKASYTINCFACHGDTGKGDGPVGVALQPPPRDFSKGDFVFDTDGDGEKGTDADLTNVIRNGAMGDVVRRRCRQPPRVRPVAQAVAAATIPHSRRDRPTRPVPPFVLLLSRTI
jgi:hypothetical protein